MPPISFGEYTFSGARDLFDSTRESAFEVERERRALEVMENREGPHGRSFAEAVRGGSHDVTAPTDARMAREDRFADTIRRDEELADFATRVLYGPDYRHGGVCACLGSAVADAVWWHYLAGETWSATARNVVTCERCCRRYRDEAFVLIDTCGVADVMAGTATAAATCP